MSAPALTGAPLVWSGNRPDEVVWHDLECGSYHADLPLWRELSALNPGPILDIGAGTGRVALALTAAGRAVSALDLDPVLLGALSERGAHAAVQTVCADARSFQLAGRDFALCLVPMQTIQLLGGSAQRIAFLRCARAHLRPEGLLACAVLQRVDCFDCARGDIGPAPETARVNGRLYVSRPTRVCAYEGRVRIERERAILVDGQRTAADRGRRAPLWSELNVIELDRLSGSELEREGAVAGLRAQPAWHVPDTAEHLGSTVVMLRA
jgi:SAM-dependent methyltransferase